ncbi:MAG TPA: GPW/gp25 family protein [Pyrinomonadaceae bacterium]|nr:GPW/gp25 family protein [Pyrinomonadaceae bacterium]
MANEFVGTGWRFPILPDETGGLGYVEGDTNVEQSLRILLLTDLGERVMRSDFGCRAPRMVFAPGSEQSLRLLETTVSEAVRDWEPRIDLEEVRAETDIEDETRVIVNISYLVRRTNTRNNLVFPFYLGTLEKV